MHAAHALTEPPVSPTTVGAARPRPSSTSAAS